MRPLSASEALSPAFERTRHVLFSPFRIGRSWKLAATGYLSCAGILFLPFPLCYLLPLAFVAPLGHAMMTGILAGAVLLTVLFVYIFHLCSRLGFAFFDIVLNRGEFVAPAWRPFGPQSRRWTLCKVLYGCVASLAMAMPVAGYVRHLMPIFRAMAQRPNQPPSPELFVAMFTGYFVVLAGFLLFGGIAALANDFIVPSLALENTTLREAFNRLLKLVRYEPGQFALYALLKFVALVVGYMAINLATQIVLVLVVAVIALVGGAIGLLLHIAGVSTTALLIAAGVVGIPLFIALSVYLTIFAAGTLATFLQAYLLCFLGGRYPMLGDLLERSTPPPLVPMPAPTPWPPEFGTPIPPPYTP